MDRSEYLIRIIVQAVNQAGNFGDKAAAQVEKITRAQGKQAESAKKTKTSIHDLDAEYTKFVDDVKKGNKSYDDAVFGLKRFSAEMDKVARAEPPGSKLAESMNRTSVAAKKLSAQMTEAHKVEKALSDQEAKDNVRRASERERLAKKISDAEIQGASREANTKIKEAVRVESEREKAARKTAEAEVKAEAAGVKNRQGLLASMLDEIHSDHRERMGFAKELADFEVKEAVRVESARQQSSSSRPSQVLHQARPSIGGRIGSFLRGDESAVRRFSEAVRGVEHDSKGAEREVSAVGRAAGRMSGSMGRAGFSIAKVDNNLRGLMVIGFIGFSQQLISAMVGLVGELVAVASAAAQAGAALGGAFVAAGAQALPVIGLLVSAFGRIGAVFKAVSLFNKEQMKSGYDQSQQAAKQASANDAITSAMEQVRSSTQRVQDATEALTGAREAAIRNIQDLNLAERSASRSKFEAGRNLQQAASSGDLGSLESLGIQKDSADVQSSRATKDAGQARSAGVRGSDQVKQANRGLQDANRALKDARRQLEAAQRSATQAADTGSAAERNLQQALAQLTPAELALYESAKRIQKRFRTIFRPITDIIVTAFGGAIDRVTKILGDDRIVKPMTSIANQIAASIGRITRFLTDAKGLGFFKDMANEASRNIPLITTLAIRIGEIARNIARAAGPALRQFIQFFIDLATQGSKATGSDSGLAKLRRFFLDGERMAESFVKLGLAVLQLFAAVAGAGGAASGQKSVDDLTAAIKKATDWVHDHKEEVKKFFSDARDTAYALAGMVLAIGKAMVSSFRSETVQHFAAAFNDVLLPALTVTIGLLGHVTDAFVRFLKLPVIGDLAMFALSVGLVYKAFSTFGRIIELVAGSRLLSFARQIKQIGPLFVLLQGVMEGAAAFLIGSWGIAIAAVAVGIFLLEKKFHFLGSAIDAVKGFFHSSSSLINDDLSKITTAEKNLADAQKNSASAQRDLTSARQDAKRQLEDLASSAASGRFQVKDAQFALKDSRSSLAEAQRGGNNDEIARASNAVDQAKQNLKDTTRSATRSEEDYTKAKKVGVEGNDQVIKSEKKLSDSRKALEGSVRALAKAHKKASDDMSKSDGDTKSSWNKVTDFIKDAANDVIHFFEDSWNNGMLLPVKIAFNDVLNIVKIVFTEVYNFLAGKSSDISDLFSKGPFGLIGKVLSLTFRAVIVVIKNVWEIIQGVVTTALDLIRGDFKGAGDDIVGMSKSIWRNLKGIFQDGVDAILGILTTMLGGISSVGSFIGGLHIPVISGAFKSAAGAIDGARRSLDGYRESLRGTTDEHKRSISSTADLINQVTALRTKLRGLTKGTSEYDDTASQLSKKQRQLNASMSDAEASGKKGAKGPRALGSAATSAASAADSANQSIAKGYNQIADQLGGVKKITYKSLGVKGPGALISGELDGRAQGGWAPTIRRALGGYGWIGGQAGGQQGPDRIPVMAGAGEAFLETRRQQPIVEEGLALRSMIKGGPGSLDQLFRMTGGAVGKVFASGGRVDDLRSTLTAFASGGSVGSVRQRADHLNSMHLPYRWGGGHGVGTIDDREARGGLDCSGAVGYALGIPARFSADYGSLGRAGDKGNVVVYSNPVHTFMRIMGRYFGTSGFGHPKSGTGAAWFTVPPTESYLRNFVARSIGGNDIGRGSGMTGLGDIHAPQINGPIGALRSLAQHAVNKITAAANRKLGAAGNASGQGLSDGVDTTGISGTNQQMARQMLKLFGWGADQWRSLKTLWQGESKWDETARNPRSGAFGIPQALPASKMGPAAQGAGPSAARAQIKWGLEYIKNRYGSPNDALSSWLSRSPHWYAEGGRVLPGYASGGELPGSPGQAIPILAHAREWILNDGQKSKLAGMVGMGVGQLRSALGLKIGRGSAAKGTEVAVNRDYKIPTIFDQSPSGIDDQIKLIQKFVRKLQLRARGFGTHFARSIELIADDGGLIDQATSAVQHVVDKMAVKLKKLSFVRGPGGAVVQRLTAQQQNAAAIGGIDAQIGGLQGLRGTAARSLSEVDRRLATIRKGGVSTKEKRSYEALVFSRRALVGKLDDLDTSIADAVQARFAAQEQVLQDSIDQVNKDAQSTLAKADLGDRMAGLVQYAGNAAGAFAIRASDIQSRIGAQSTQRNALLPLLAQAQAQGSTSIAQNLISQIDDLNVSIKENVQALAANTVAARQAAIDSITQRGGFLGGIFSNLGGIVQTIGAISGSVDVAEFVKLAKQGAQTLAQTGDALKGQLLQGYGVNLTGLGGRGLVNALSSLNYDGIEANFTTDQRQQFEALIQAIIDNEGAVQSNTQQIQQLNSTQEQSFSTTAWQLFRQAIFNGSGGLLPQYNIPTMGTGGSMLAGGMSPSSSPRSLTSGSGSGVRNGDSINVNVTSPTEVLDPRYIADVVSFRRPLERAS